MAAIDSERIQRWPIFAAAIAKAVDTQKQNWKLAMPHHIQNVASENESFLKRDLWFWRTGAIGQGTPQCDTLSFNDRNPWAQVEVEVSNCA